MAMVWTKEDDEKLKVLYLSKKYTSVQIAEMFEQDVTASSVRARVSSLGINNRRVKTKEGFKYCNGCETVHPLDEFYPRKSCEPDGKRMSRCKQCLMIYKKNNYKNK